jgi:hypothetical protein
MSEGHRKRASLEMNEWKSYQKRERTAVRHSLQRLDDMKGVVGCGLGPTPDNMNNTIKVELSSHEGTRGEFNPRTVAIKLGIDVHQEFYVMVCRKEGATRSRRNASQFLVHRSH